MGQNSACCHEHLLLIEKQRECIKGLIFALCHNFRGPIATASGLISLIEVGLLTEENIQAVHMLKEQLNMLDERLFELIKKHEELILIIG